MFPADDLTPLKALADAPPLPALATEDDPPLTTPLEEVETSDPGEIGGEIETTEAVGEVGDLRDDEDLFGDKRLEVLLLALVVGLEVVLGLGLSFAVV